jgi:hypothetical protein
MLPEGLSLRFQPLALLLTLAALGGCAASGLARTSKPEGQMVVPTQDRETMTALLLADTLQSVQRMAQADTSGQAEILSAARSAFERAPLGSAQFRYALMLAMPGPAVRDPEQARILMRELAAQQANLSPVERALLLLQLAQLDRELGLKADNQRLQTEAQRTERDRQAVANRRLQTEVDENAKLRKQLEDAQAKLEALAKIERSLTSEGRKP